MKKRLLAAALLCELVLSFSLFSCGRDVPRDTETPDTEPVSEQQTTAVTETCVPEAISYTVPTRMVKDGADRLVFNYSPDGMWLTVTDNREEVPIVYTVSFDESGRLLKREWVVVVNDTRTERWRDDYYLDDLGRITDEKRYCEGEIQMAYTYTYDSEGRIETQQSRNIKQENITYRLLYDDMGTHVGTRYKKYNGEEGDYEEPTVCTYDGEGRLLTETCGTFRVSYEYTTKGKYITRKKVTSGTEDFYWVSYYQYTYEDGHMVKEECLYDAKVAETTYYTQTAYEHYYRAVEWIMRERLP